LECHKVDYLGGEIAVNTIMLYVLEVV